MLVLVNERYLELMKVPLIMLVLVNERYLELMKVQSTMLVLAKARYLEPDDGHTPHVALHVWNTPTLEYFFC